MEASKTLMKILVLIVADEATLLQPDFKLENSSAVVVNGRCSNISTPSEGFISLKKFPLQASTKYVCVGSEKKAIQVKKKEESDNFLPCGSSNACVSSTL